MGATYRDIKTDVMGRITRGEWQPGALLPNEVELAKSYDCARATVNRALRELAEEGLLDRKRKSGTRVRMAPIRQARFDMPLTRKEVEAQGKTYRYALVRRDDSTASDWLAARMALAPDTPVLHLLCMHYADGQPFQFEDRWINLDALPKARDVDFSAHNPNEWLVSAIPFSDVEIGFSAISAGAMLADHMGCDPGDALFRMDRSTWLEGKPITYVRLTYQRNYRMMTRY